MIEPPFGKFFIGVFDQSDSRVGNENIFLSDFIYDDDRANVLRMVMGLRCGTDHMRH